MGYSPWGQKESDTTEPLTLNTFFSFLRSRSGLGSGNLHLSQVP